MLGGTPRPAAALAPLGAPGACEAGGKSSPEAVPPPPPAAAAASGGSPQSPGFCGPRPVPRRWRSAARARALGGTWPR